MPLAHPLRDPLIARLDAHLRRGLNVPDGAGLRVALSGGPDSTALVAALAALAPVRGYRVRASHVHHGLVEAADAWERTCRATCDRLGVPLAVARWDGDVATGESEEAAARRARYELLAAELGPDEWLFTAHHADDQAETVLLFLARGAGLDGLSGIERQRPFGSGWLARPLLPFARGELADLIRRMDLATVDDPANRDPRLARARIRQQGLPCLEDAFGSGVVPAAARSADALQDAREVLDGVVAERLVGLRREGGLDAAGLASLAPAEGRLVLRAALREAGWLPPRRDVLERARALAEGGEGEVAWADGAVHRRGDCLCFGPIPRSDSEEACWHPRQGPLWWPALDAVLEAVPEVAAAPPWPEPRAGQLLPAHAGPWQVRPVAAGERIRVAGRPGERSVRELLRAHGVPAPLRRIWPVMTDTGGRVLALPGVATAEAGRVRPGEPVWRVRWFEGPDPLSDEPQTKNGKAE